jgi:hypothetical protein
VEHAAESTTAAEEDAAAVAHFDEALRLEHRERLAQRRPADLETRRQLALGRKPLANLEVGADDELPQTLDEILIQTRASERTER